MDCYNIPTGHYKINLKVGITSNSPIDLVIKGYDPDHINSVYFEREIGFFKGSREFDVPMPISPERLRLCVYEKGNKAGNLVKINYVKAVQLSQYNPPFNTPADKEYYSFIEKFCKEMGYKKPGITYSPSKRFEIKISQRILEEDGSESSTPARIFHPYGEIEVHEDKFKKMTVFMRVMILLHEYMHSRLNTASETRADEYAAKTYTAFGYPKTEALNSFIKVFTPINEKHEQDLINRTDKLYNFLKFN